MRTGYEQIIGKRAGEGYCSIAKDDGKVLSVDETGVIVQYKDGSTQGFELGTRYGHAGGLTIPHSMQTALKPGDKISKEDVIVYNADWFEKDVVNPRSVIMKYGTTARVALAETKQTFEDASSISAELAQKLSTKITKVKKIVVNFKQSVKNLVKVGHAVEFDTLLCIIEDEITANTGMFNEDTISALSMLSAQVPTAKVKGVVERIEIYYNGDKQDMSASLKTIADNSDKELAKRLKSQHKTVMSGKVDESYRIEGEPLLLDHLVICVYITSDTPAVTGDKGVFGNQMKTVFSEIMEYDLHTESGLKVDAWFGALSISNRIVNSPISIGTTNVLLRLAGEKAYQAYKGKT